MVLTQFEDLSNEGIYEIFDYLDYFYVYNAFYNLNIRFRHLIIHSNLPIQIDLTHGSKSSWTRYHTDIITNNMHRINSIRLSNSCIYDDIRLSLESMIQFNRIENLILENIEYTQLARLIKRLFSLSHLSALTMTVVDDVSDGKIIYQQIFRLPVLKYCKLAFLTGRRWETLPMCENKTSSIEYLIIKNPIYIDELNALLSYVPQLRRLALHLETSIRRTKDERCLSVCRDLRNLSIQLGKVKFDIFEEMIEQFFGMIEIFSLTRTGAIDINYLNASKWEKLIQSSLTHLRIFDIRYDFPIDPNSSILEKCLQMNDLSRAYCSFAHGSYSSHSGTRGSFYSINPYRRKQYTLDDRWMSIEGLDMNFNSVRQIDIHNEEQISSCRMFFPNAIQLYLKKNFRCESSSIANLLHRIISLTQINKLVIECEHFSLYHLIDLLSCTSNLHTLIFQSISFHKDDQLLLEQNERFRRVCEMNRIQCIIFHELCTMERVKLLVTLCPRVEHLTIQVSMEIIKAVTRFLLKKNNPNTRYLSSICFTNLSQSWYTGLEALIKFERLLDHYACKSTDTQLYLWW